MQETPRNMCIRKLGREGERAISRRTRVGERILSPSAREEVNTEVGPGPRQCAPGERIVRVKLSGLREEFDRLAEVCFSGAGIIKLALQEGVVGVQTPARGPLALSCRVLTGQKLRPQRPRHRAGDLIL